MSGTPGGGPWLPTAPCTPSGCAVGQWPLVGPCTAAARLVAAVALILLGAVCAPLVRGDRTVRLWSRALLRALGVRVRVLGDIRETDGAAGALVVANHVSWLDIPLIAAVLPGRMLAKSEVRGWPVLGPLAVLGGTLFVDRERLRALPGTVREIAAALTGGSRVVVFPEGSTWCGRGDGGPFRAAPFQAALDAGAAVQPVRIGYRPTGAAAFVGDDPLGTSLWRVARTAGLCAEIEVLPPIGAADPTLIPMPHRAARRALADAARRAVIRPAAPRPASVRTQTAVASDSANLLSSSIHQ
ncbi:lysophospholipid acyltransferase family protein [Streptomyces sp. NPDC050504]|uniref:lysophospholipid acyltransferase family protein n=1 Tax=Streptomyces sp. NPDC050504 TaxID=3365618 RepID=UPI0037B39FBA